MQRSEQEGGVHGGTHFSTLFMSESLERHVYMREARTVDDKKIYILVQVSMATHADLPNVPSVMEAAKTDEQKQILKLIFARQVMGRPFMAPPNVPADRVKALRDGFWATMQDKEFLEESDKAKLEITPVKGEDIQKLVEESYKVPPEIAKKAGELIK
jgi:hypothetical protein